jgi:hypothetical protein
MRALDYKETSRSHGQVDRALESASDDVEGLTHRRFYPQVATRSFDWPDLNRSRSWRLWLGANELVSVATLTSGGVVIPPSAYFARRSDNLEEPPYTHIEISLDSSATFGGGVTTQRDISVAGVFGYTAAERTAGALAGALNSSQATVDVTDSAAIGVGHLIRVETERMLVTDRGMLDTGQNLAGNLTASMAEVTVPVANGTAYGIDEVILIDAERMLIVDIAGNNLIVKRQWDGSTLAAHTTGADVYASRRLTVERAAQGTTAASHGSGTAIARHTPPGLIRDLCVAEALDQMLQEPAGYARAGSVQDNSHNSISVSNIRSSKYQLGLGIDGLRDRAYAAFGRKARIGAV